MTKTDCFDGIGLLDDKNWLFWWNWFIRLHEKCL